MKDLQILCSLIAQIMDEYSEDVFEDGILTFRFDCFDFHYECKVERTMKEDDKNEKTNN